MGDGQRNRNFSLNICNYFWPLSVLTIFGYKNCLSLSKKYGEMGQMVEVENLNHF